MLRLATCWLLALAASACSRPDVRFPQFVQDDTVVWTVSTGIDALLKAALAGQSVGEVSLTTPCEGGGSMQVTGTLAASGAADLTLELVDCGVEWTASDGTSACTLTLAGPMTYAFFADPATGLPREELRSDELAIEGAVTHRGERRELNDRCPLAVTLTANDVSVALYGEICGRDTASALSHATCGT